MELDRKGRNRPVGPVLGRSRLAAEARHGKAGVQQPQAGGELLAPHLGHSACILDGNLEREAPGRAGGVRTVLHHTRRGGCPGRHRLELACQPQVGECEVAHWSAEASQDIDPAGCKHGCS